MIDEEVIEAISEFKRASENDQSLKRLAEFYEKMKLAGVVQSRGYNLPPIDTVGTSVYRNRRQ